LYSSWKIENRHISSNEITIKPSNPASHLEEMEKLQRQTQSYTLIFYCIANPLTLPTASLWLIALFFNTISFDTGHRREETKLHLLRRVHTIIVQRVFLHRTNHVVGNCEVHGTAVSNETVAL
jgi:hypothetical protein